jgi:hypothetical protein
MVRDLNACSRNNCPGRICNGSGDGSGVALKGICSWEKHCGEEKQRKKQPKGGPAHERKTPVETGKKAFKDDAFSNS